ncbi:MAG: hypothetical protein ACOYOB_18845 [Myxococcota bacterium]
MAKFRKKPVVIEAFRYGHDDSPDWMEEALEKEFARVHESPARIAIDTPEGTMTARRGDWVIRGIHGEIYPCKHEIFQATYEPAE